jgi:hypothetical protein
LAKHALTHFNAERVRRNHRGDRYRRVTPERMVAEFLLAMIAVQQDLTRLMP